MRSLLSCRFILRVIGVVAWVISGAWVYYEPGFEPVITFLTGAAAIFGSFFVSDKPIKILEISEEENRARDRRNRMAMLRLVNEMWVEGVLKKSLHNAVLIELGLKERKDAVEQPNRPWDMIVRTVDEPNRVLPPGTKIVDVLDKAKQALLILGEPGSGKTTTLLELARQTIGRAEEDPTQPISVVFNLSSWIDPTQSVVDWLVDELNKKYNIPKKIAQAWVENDQLLLLLDGLDEVAVERRNACVKTINEFRQEHLVPIVICSRMAEYEALTTSLKVHSAVCIQPLTEEQVSDYLDKFGAELTTVSDMLQDDEPMRELSRSPLMLNIMTIAYKGASKEELQKLDTVEARREHLFNKYIDRMFNRVARTKNELYSRDKTTRWLFWLAEKMTQNAQSVFLIEKIQPTWLQTRAQQQQYTINTVLITSLIVGLIAGLIAGLSTWLIKGELIDGLIGGLNGGVIAGLTSGVIAGLVYGRDKTIETIESLKWSWKKAKGGLILGLIWGLILVLIWGLFLVLIWGLFLGLIIGLIVGLTFGPIQTLILSGLRYAEVEERTVPNQGIRQSIRNAAIVWIATIISSAMIAGLAAVLVVVLGPNVGLDATAVKVVVGFLLFAMLSLAFILALVGCGGMSVIKHFVLRFILYRNDYLPWNIVRFLDYAAERIFLQKVGGGYKFIHRLIQEHFASLGQDSK